MAGLSTPHATTKILLIGLGDIRFRPIKCSHVTSSASYRLLSGKYGINDCEKQPGADRRAVRFMRSCAIAMFTSMFFLINMEREAFAQNKLPSEYQIKAAFLFNFAKFVEWPSKSLIDDKSPITIAVLGNNVFDNSLEKTVQGKFVDEHPLAVKFIHSELEATNCQILFISPSEKGKVAEVLKTLKGSSTLTISELDGFIQSGGMINFVVEGTKVRFQINREATTLAGLRVSSKLISIALPTNR